MNGNLGVWDTLAAIEWTKKYICKFGGDPDNITVIGQSAGAGVITWLLLAEEGKLELPFDQAWISSPALPPRRDLERSRPVFDFALNATGCADLNCMRNVSEAELLEANKLIFNQVNSAGGGALGLAPGLTPTVDGELVSELPARALAEGKINQGMKKLVVGNTAFEVGCPIIFIWSSTDCFRVLAYLPIVKCQGAFLRLSGLTSPMPPTQA